MASKRHQSGTVDRYHAAVLDLIANPGKYPKNEWATAHGISAGLPSLMVKLGMAARDGRNGPLRATVPVFTREDALALLELSNDVVNASNRGEPPPRVLPSDLVRLPATAPGTRPGGPPWTLSLLRLLRVTVDVRRPAPSAGDRVRVTGIPSLRNLPGEAPTYVGLEGEVRHVYDDGAFNLTVTRHPGHSGGGTVLVGRRYRWEPLEETPTNPTPST